MQNHTTLTDSLDPRQEKFLIALLANPVVVVAAKEAGICVRTAHNYLADPKFQKVYRQARHQAVSQAVAQLQTRTSTMVETLFAIMADPNAPAAARISAVRTGLDRALTTTESETLIERVLDLESRLTHTEEAHEAENSKDHRR